jgi:hypothetical protein
MDVLPEPTRLLYSQLLTQCLHGAAPSGRGLSFVSKQIKGGKHWYLQLTVGSRKTQHYVGPDTDAVRELIEKERSHWASAAPDVAAREELVSMLVSGGAHTVSAVEARLFELLERTGVFAAGGVLIGSHAFTLYGNMLGVKWESETTRTQDVDLAADYRLIVGVPDRDINLHQTLIDSDLGFIEVPALDRKSPSTKFRIKGKQLSVDILTPLLGRPSSKPVRLGSLNIYAEPVRFLDYVLEDAQPAVITARAGILVNVPPPARYALHKLVTSERRIAAMHTKTRKDIDQAAQLINVLLRDRLGDLRIAWRAAQKQPAKFRQQLRGGLARLPKDVQTALSKDIVKNSRA